MSSKHVRQQNIQILQELNMITESMANDGSSICSIYTDGLKVKIHKQGYKVSDDSVSEQRRSRSDCASAQSDLDLHCPQIVYEPFSWLHISF